MGMCDLFFFRIMTCINVINVFLLLPKAVDGDANECKTICGTNEYMAPEMVKGDSYGKAVDWWAMGALLFEMVVGKPPFYNKSQKKLYNMSTS